MVGFAFGVEIPLETGFDTGCNDDDTSVFPACHDTRSFLGSGKGTGASTMSKSAADEALTRLGARISAFWKGHARNRRDFAPIIRFVSCRTTLSLRGGAGGRESRCSGERLHGERRGREFNFVL